MSDISINGISCFLNNLAHQRHLKFFLQYFYDCTCVIIVLTGLREAKMKVLEQLQKVMVRDIQKFVDWLKTVRVEYNAGGKHKAFILRLSNHWS